ncbi:MAG: PIN domain-containing protein [Saprospiraceae bacterium]
MSKKLVKVAKKLGVGTTTIVEHLMKNGFQVENRPTAKVSDEMYRLLLMTFDESISKKKKAKLKIELRKKKEVEAAVREKNELAKEKERLAKEEERKVEEEKNALLEARKKEEAVRLAEEREKNREKNSRKNEVKAKSKPAGLKVGSKINLDKKGTKPKNQNRRTKNRSNQSPKNQAKKQRIKRVILPTFFDKEVASIPQNEVEMRHSNKKTNASNTKENNKEIGLIALSDKEARRRTNEIKIQARLHQNKKLTEHFVGIIPFKWTFTEAHYTAELTEAVDFSLFDKVICGILQIDEVASFEEIAAILGMNVIENAENKQYLDPAEKEILEEALDVLVAYEMIEIGDSNYSRCYLTPLGKEYAKIGRKFNVTPNKSFKLYYDHFGTEHQVAKNHFANLKGKIVSTSAEYNFLDIHLMEQIAAVQTPNIYNLEPQKLKRFRDPKLDEKLTTSYEVELYACCVADSETKNLRLLVFEPQCGQFHSGITKVLNGLSNEKDNLILEFLSKNIYFEDEKNNVVVHQKQLLSQQDNLDKLLSKGKVAEAQKFVSQVSIRTNFIDINYFWSNLHQFLNGNYKEIWLVFSVIDKPTLDYLKHQLKQLDDTSQTMLFVVLPTQFDMANDSENLWILSQEEVEKDFIGLVKNDENIELLEVTDYPVKISIDGEHTLVSTSMYFRSEDRQLQKHFAEAEKHYIKRLVEEKINQRKEYFNQIEGHIISKKEIINLEKVDLFAKFNYPVLENFQVFKNKKIAQLKNKHSKRLHTALFELEKSFKANNNEQIGKLEPFKNKLETIFKELFENDSRNHNYLKIIQRVIKRQEEKIKSKFYTKTYIIDTNIFINKPDILNYISKNDTAIISAKVIDELDKLKQKKELSQAISKAIKNINSARTKQNVQYSFGKKQLLPDDFDKRSPDNLILSVAMLYQRDKKSNPVLLTSDNGLQVKSDMLNIKTIGLEDFLKENKKEPTVEKQQIKNRNNRSRNNRNRNNRKKR